MHDFWWFVGLAGWPQLTRSLHGNHPCAVLSRPHSQAGPNSTQHPNTLNCVWTTRADLPAWNVPECSELCYGQSYGPCCIHKHERTRSLFQVPTTNIRAAGWPRGGNMPLNTPIPYLLHPCSSPDTGLGRRWHHRGGLPGTHLSCPDGRRRHITITPTAYNTPSSLHLSCPDGRRRHITLTHADPPHVGVMVMQ